MRPTIALSLFCLPLCACSLADLSPASGYPDYESKGQGYVPLAPETIYDFGQNPTIVD